MDGNKLELTGAKPATDKPANYGDYRAIPEAVMEEEAVTRPKSVVKSKPSSPEIDGADEKMLPNEDAVKIAVNEKEKQNGDAKLDIGEIKTAFVGLTKEELMKYANDPFWVRIRWFLFITFWIVWGMMLIGAIMIILATPKCTAPPPRTWWEKGPLVELDEPETESVEKINKLKELGATGVIVSWSEDAYVDFNETHDLIRAIKAYKEQQINVILELEPGFSNVWFDKSEVGDSEFGEFYIWQPAKERINGESPTPPNNWVTVNNTPAWIFSEKRNEFYYAPFGQPHLNFRNPNVTEKFSEVLKKFLSMGVEGVRLKRAPNLLVDAKLSNESPVVNPGDCVLTDYCFYTHTQTENLKDLAEILKKWRTVVKHNTDNGPFMISEEIGTNIESYRINSTYIVDLPIQRHLFYKGDTNVTNIIHILNTTFNVNNVTWPLWKVNSTSEWDIIAYLLPGTPLIRLDSVDNKEILKKRNLPSIMRGNFHSYSLNNDTVLAFIRVTAGNPAILVAYNPSDNRTVVDFPSQIDVVSDDVTVSLWSQNYNESDIAINVQYGANAIPISPKSAIVLSYVPPK